MNIELLNTRIFISKNELVTDEIENHKNTWNPYYTCYATVSSETGSENTDAGTSVENTKVYFTIRWCKLAAAITSTQFRVQFGNDIYDITSVDHMNYKKKCIKLSCQKVRR